VVPAEVLARYAIGPILDAVEWGGTAGRTFRLSTAQGVFFLRRRGPRSSSPERIAFDHGFRHFLVCRGVPTAEPRETTDGLRWVASPDGVYELYPFVEGRAHRSGDLRQIASAARALAAFHDASVEYRIRAGPSPLLEQFSLAVPDTPPSHRIDDPACLRHALQRLSAGLTGAEGSAAHGMLDLVEMVDRAFGGATYDGLDRYVIHGDFHPANLVFGVAGSVAGIFDLDWATNAPRLRDLADALHFFASTPVATGSDIRSLVAPRRPRPELASALLTVYHEAAPLDLAELDALRWAWLGRWLAMHTDGAYKVPAAERGSFLTAGVLAMADGILRFDAGSAIRPHASRQR
jgi:Ser/Thr protein kinase RdoA (MazF antagonist)